MIPAQLVDTSLHKLDILIWNSYSDMFNIFWYKKKFVNDSLNIYPSPLTTLPSSQASYVFNPSPHAGVQSWHAVALHVCVQQTGQCIRGSVCVCAATVNECRHLSVIAFGCVCNWVWADDVRLGHSWHEVVQVGTNTGHVGESHGWQDQHLLCAGNWAQLHAAHTSNTRAHTSTQDNTDRAQRGRACTSRLPDTWQSDRSSLIRRPQCAVASSWRTSKLGCPTLQCNPTTNGSANGEFWLDTHVWNERVSVCVTKRSMYVRAATL
jgi:hypothetical protein